MMFENFQFCNKNFFGAKILMCKKSLLHQMLTLLKAKLLLNLPFLMAFLCIPQISFIHLKKPYSFAIRTLSKISKIFFGYLRVIVFLDKFFITTLRNSLGALLL